MQIKMNKKSWTLIVISLFALILVIDSYSKNVFFNRIIFESPCAVPCWNNIIPGITTEKELKEKIKEIKVMELKTFKETDRVYLGFDKIIEISSKPALIIPISNKLKITFYLSKGLVKDIEICGKLKMNLKELFNKIDAPTHISTFSCCGDIAGIAGEVINKNIGYAAYIDKLFFKDDPLTHNDKIRCLDYFDPADFQKLKEDGYFSERIFPWSGYTDNFIEKYFLSN